MKVFLHHDHGGRSFSGDYIRKLRVQSDRAVILNTIGIVSRLDHPPEKWWKRLTGSPGLYEIRAKAYRLIAFHLEGETWVIIHAFKKGGKKGQQHEIDVAADRKALYYPGIK